MDIRLQQFCYWPLQYITVRQRKDDVGGATNSHPDYIRFYNSLWLVANDIIIGIALGSYIIENAGVVAQNIDYYVKVRILLWLRIHEADPTRLTRSKAWAAQSNGS
jgi:phosphatidylinositol glycan class Q protein